MKFKLESFMQNATKANLLAHKAHLENAQELIEASDFHEVLYADYMRTLERHIEIVDLVLMNVE